MCSPRKRFKITKYLLAGVTVVCVSWIASVSDWRSRERVVSRSEDPQLSTMKTIVAYSEGKLAEMERPLPLSCDRLPAYPKINNFNHTWVRGEEYDWSASWTPIKGSGVSLYAAYYDDRTPQHYVRILATFEGRSMVSEPPLYCQVRPLDPEDNAVLVVEARPFEIWWSNWDHISKEVETPILFSCPLIEPLLDTSVVSIVTEPCEDPLNAFQLDIDIKIPKKYLRKFTICVKDMYFKEDISQDLTEWIETNKALGVDLIDIYVDKVTADTEKVLQFYKEQRIVRMFNAPIRNMPRRLLWQRRRDHIISYNDCLYRNIKDSEFIIPLDIDEIIVPKRAYTLPELLTRLSSKGWDANKSSAILIQNVFFFGFMQIIKKPPKAHVTRIDEDDVYIKRDDVRIFKSEYFGEVKRPNEVKRHTSSRINREINFRDNEKVKYLYKSRCNASLPELNKLTRHIVRSQKISPYGHYIKSIMVTKQVITAFNHYPLSNFIETKLSAWDAPFTEVQLNHYKKSCNNTVMGGDCPSYERHKRIDRVAARLQGRVLAAIANGPCLPIKTS